MDAIYPAVPSGSMLQTSLEAGKREEANLILVEGSPTPIASYFAGSFNSDVLALAIGVCSFFICRTLLSPILLPESDSLAKGNDLVFASIEEEKMMQTEEDDQHAEDPFEPAEAPKQLSQQSKYQEEAKKSEEVSYVTGLSSRNGQPELVVVEAEHRRREHGKERKDCFGCTQLHIAAHLGDATEVAELLDNGFNVNAQESCGDTPLHMAVRSGCTETVQALLSGGARPNMRNIFESTPLSIAASFKDKSMYNLLQAAKARKTF
eukprot:TRINITY_DN5204_c0_g1_i1.p1 TRINITY_DN5204_c0_g1~~TRINITY_DN5204_c0_g1_i1.p1  ORF type:complete len:264 (+),score=62.78 TRINITY_DN5204_c0_g1_i1:83-874(+)